MYFTVTGDGKPLRQRRYCFSEGFYALANAEYYAVTGDRECLERARRAYEPVSYTHLDVYKRQSLMRVMETWSLPARRGAMVLMK